MGVRSDGVTVWCNQGENYYECTPDYPQTAPPNPTDCGPDTYPCDGSGSDTGSGSGSGSDTGSGSGSDGSGSGTCGPDTFPCDDGGGGDGSGSGGDGGGGDGGGNECEPWPVGTATVLWPPNHKMHTYTLADCAKVDVCPNGSAIADGTVTKITVDEEIEVNAGGDGHTTIYDAAIIDNKHFELRSERQGGMDGRVYTVYYVDSNGADGSCQFLVPHNRGPHEGAVDSGTKVTILP
ncbi:MAG TPA: hypothetical protein VIV40_44330 [Kofleriaceae bacterium]